MPLPLFANYRAVWIEKTKSGHGHGGDGWEFGTCLWSPTRDKTNRRVYENMTRAQAGDLVIHLYKDKPFGLKEDYYFCGLSLVTGSVKLHKSEPPKPGDWAGREEYYRIDLLGFEPFATPISISEFIEKSGLELFDGPPVGEPSFIMIDGRVRLAQGKYLASCDMHLYELLSKALYEVASPPEKPDDNTSSTDASKSTLPFDYEEYVEGQRAKREANYFKRNPQLVRDAKAHFEGRCQACLFEFTQLYPELGAGYIEIHHLNPLSEVGASNGDKKISKLSQVTALCANCHRMIHRLIRKQGCAVTLEEFRRHLKSGNSTSAGPPTC